MVQSVLFGTAIALASPAFAQATPDLATLAAARELMLAAGVDEQLHATARHNVETWVQRLNEESNGRAIPAPLRAQMHEAWQDFFGRLDEMLTPQFMNKVAALYASHFTIAELQHISAIMKEPVSVKFRREKSGGAVDASHFTPGERQRLEAITIDPIMVKYRREKPGAAEMKPLLIENFEPAFERTTQKIERLVADWEKAHPEEEAVTPAALPSAAPSPAELPPAETPPAASPPAEPTPPVKNQD